MGLTKDMVVVATSRMVAADVGEGVVILHLESGSYFTLENVAARVWTLIKEPIAVGEIERVLIEEYEVDAQQCHREVIQLLSDLIDEGLLEVHEPTA